MKFLPVAALALLAFAGPFASRAGEKADIPAATLAKWFGPGVSQKPVGTNGLEESVLQVAGLDGRVRGWAFRTDQVPPAVKGKRGEISVLVGLGLDGRIKAVEVLGHHEDSHWFSRLKPPFFRQFENLPADGSGKPVDTVTGATVSSRAIANDVGLSCRTVLALPAVRAALSPEKPGAR